MLPTNPCFFVKPTSSSNWNSNIMARGVLRISLDNVKHSSCTRILVKVAFNRLQEFNCLKTSYTIGSFLPSNCNRSIYLPWSWCKLRYIFTAQPSLLEDFLCQFLLCRSLSFCSAGVSQHLFTAPFSILINVNSHCWLPLSCLCSHRT